MSYILSNSIHQFPCHHSMNLLIKATNLPKKAKRKLSSKKNCISLRKKNIIHNKISMQSLCFSCQCQAQCHANRSQKTIQLILNPDSIHTNDRMHSIVPIHSNFLKLKLMEESMHFKIVYDKTRYDKKGYNKAHSTSAHNTNVHVTKSGYNTLQDSNHFTTSTIDSIVNDGTKWKTYYKSRSDPGNHNIFHIVNTPAQPTRPPSLYNRNTCQVPQVYFKSNSIRQYSSLVKSDENKSEHNIMMQHSDLRLKQLTTKSEKGFDPTLTSEVIHEVKEAIQHRTLGGKGLTFALKYLKENRKYREAWELSIDAFEFIPMNQLMKYIPAISVVLLMIARKLGDKETTFVVENLINPQDGNKLMWYSALNSIRETKDERVSHLFLKSYDNLKHKLNFDDKGLAVLLQYFSTFGDLERSIEAFEARYLDETSPLFIKNRSPRLLSAYFHHLTVMGKRNKTRDFSRERIIHYYNTLCIDDTKSNYITPDPYVISKVISSCTASFDLEAARDFFQNAAVPYMKKHTLNAEEASLIAFPLVVPWIKHSDYNTVIWFFERYFSGDEKLSEWNTPLLNMAMHAYYSMKKYDKVIAIFEEYFASGKRVPSSKTFNILLLTKCIQDHSFNMSDAMKTFHQYKDSLPTGAPIPADYNTHLLMKKEERREVVSGPIYHGDYLDTKTLQRRNIPPGLIKAVITSLIERKNVAAAIQFFNTYCQDPTKEHFAMPPYRSIREIAQGILEIENDPEKALTFLENAKIDARYIPPTSLIVILKKIYHMDESIERERVQAQLDRLYNLGAIVTDLIGEESININEDEDSEPISNDEIEEPQETTEYMDELEDEVIIEERDEF